MSNNVQRVLVAVVAIPLAIGIVFLGGLPMALLVAAAAGLGTRELLALAERQGVAPLNGLAILAAVAVPLGVWIQYGDRLLMLPGYGAVLLPSIWYSLATYLLVVLAATLWRRSPEQRPLGVASVTLLAPLYCAVLPSFLLGVRYALGGERNIPATAAVFFPLAITWICDSFAMWGGKLMGGPKLAPVVSPGKTRTGAASGVVGGALAALLFNRLALTPLGFTMSDAEALLAGIVLSVVAQIGDLAESLFKREAGVKDSGTLIPGHGGVLDRLDSLYFVIPVAAMLYRLFGVI